MFYLKKNYLKKYLFACVIAFLIIIGMSIHALAEGTDKGITQTGAGEKTATITWDKDNQAYGYNVYISSDGKNYSRITTEKICDVSSDTYKKISGLKTGSTYYVMVASVYKSDTDVVTEGAKSDAVQIVTSPSRVTSSSIKQVKATSENVTVKWNAAKGATGYIVYLNDKKVKTVTTANAVITATAGSINSVKIIPIRISAAGYKAKGGHSEAYDIYAAPAKPVKLASFKANNLTWHPTLSKNITVGWSNSSLNKYQVSGYQVQIYSVDGKKKIKTYNTTKGQVKLTGSLANSVKNKGFKIRVRGYIKVNGKKQYGAWTSLKTVIPQAKISLNRTGNKKLTVKWKKIKNVQKYYIYVCKDINAKNPKWKKVATVGSNKTSYVIKNCKVGKYNAVYVIPEVKVGGKKYKAEYTWYLYMQLK
jgi:hypothetical protein